MPLWHRIGKTIPFYFIHFNQMFYEKNQQILTVHAISANDSVQRCTGFSTHTTHNDLARTGQNTQETILTTSNVNASTFGRIFTRSVDDQVYVQPLIVSGLKIQNGTHTSSC
jgi:hypothetical protein